MKVYQVTLYILCFSLCFNLLNAANLFGHQFIQPDNTLIQQLKHNTEYNYSQTQVGQQSGGILGFVADAVFGVGILVDSLFYATIGILPMVAKIFGNSTEAWYIAAILTAPVYIIYSVALAQWILKVRAED